MNLVITIGNSDIQISADPGNGFAVPYPVADEE